MIKNDSSLRKTGYLFLFGGLFLMIISFVVRSKLMFIVSIGLFLIGYNSFPDDKNHLFDRKLKNPKR